MSQIQNKPDFSFRGHIPKVMVLIFRVHCGTLNSNQSKEYECVMEFPLNHYPDLRSFEIYAVQKPYSVDSDTRSFYLYISVETLRK